MALRDNLTKKFGYPTDKDFEKKNMELWYCQKEFPTLSVRRMYVNKYLIPFLRVTFAELLKRDLLKEIRKYDGCWMIRPVRGYKNLLSIHSYAIAIDLNAADNPLGWDRKKCLQMGLKPFSEEFVKVWEDTGWVAGYKFKRCDGMHFERTREFGGDQVW